MLCAHTRWTAVTYVQCCDCLCDRNCFEQVYRAGFLNKMRYLQSAQCPESHGPCFAGCFWLSCQSDAAPTLIMHVATRCSAGAGSEHAQPLQAGAGSHAQEAAAGGTGNSSSQCWQDAGACWALWAGTGGLHLTWVAGSCVLLQELCGKLAAPQLSRSAADSIKAQQPCIWVWCCRSTLFAADTPHGGALHTIGLWAATFHNQHSSLAAAYS